MSSNDISPPVIDISRLFTSNDCNVTEDCDQDFKMNIALQIDQAFRDFGVFVAVGHVNSYSDEKKFDAATSLFSLSLPNKQSVALSTTG
jgi:isopenicillin N synthase-like dioxygenase